MKKAVAIEHFGSLTKLANALKITKGSVSQWGEYPPFGRQCQIELLTNGKLKADKSEDKKVA